jgi:hypothetical protein
MFSFQPKSVTVVCILISYLFKTVVTVCTICLHIKPLNIFPHRVFVCVLYDADKQQLFPFTALAPFCLCSGENECCCEIGTEFFNLIFTDSRF